MKKNIVVYEGLVRMEYITDTKCMCCVDTDVVEYMVDPFEGKRVRITIEELEENE